MRTYKKIRKVSIELEKHTCDGCGYDANAPDSFVGKIQTLDITFGYGSKVDGERFEFDICDTCFLKLFKKFIKNK